MLITNDSGCDLLRTEIIRQAVKDVVRGYRCKDQRQNIKKQALRNMEDAEAFLLSDWADWLVDIDCKKLLKKVREHFGLEKIKTVETTDEAEDI